MVLKPLPFPQKPFVRHYCLWFIIARIAESNPYPFLHPKHPPTSPAPITFLGLDRLMMYAKTTGMHCPSAHSISMVAKAPSPNIVRLTVADDEPEAPSRWLRHSVPIQRGRPIWRV